jgi:hypothetical protein
MSFCAAALLRPEIQTIAQEQLDAVTRRERLPTFEDRLRLPFVDAICKEVSRWRPAVPLGELLRTQKVRRIDDPQVCPMQRQEMTSIMVFSSPRVGILDIKICSVVG